MSAESEFLDAVSDLGPALLSALDALEQAQRQLHPPAIAALRAALTPVEAALRETATAFEASDHPEGAADFRAQLLVATGHACDALRDFLDPTPGPDATLRILGAMRAHCRAQAALYPLRTALLPISRFFLERPVWDRADELDPPAGEHRVGMHHAHNGPDERGGFTLYVPESYDGTPLPLVIALHGGAGHGADFLWTWLREARGRRFLLMAPTSRGSTWSLMGPDIDAAPLDSMIAFVMERWQVDADHVLVTGLSDGATYALLYGLREQAPCTALAPISGVLHPANFANGNMARARGRRIHLVHGTLDWMFPIALARAAAEELERVGAELVFHEIEDLSHTYPRDENDRILRWLSPGLGLPEPSAG